jgi:Ca2+-binding EF-hand superfamily protein
VKSVHDQLCDRYGSSSSATRKAIEAIEDVDHDSDGKITLKEFHESLHILKIELTKAEVVSLFEKLDSSESGKFRCDDFIDLVFKDSEKDITPPKSRVRSKLDIRSIIEDLQDAILTELGPGAGSARQVKRIFSDIDLNDDGKIDKKEFQKAMHMLKLPIGEREADFIFEKYDRDGNGRLNYSEFIDLIDFHAKPRDERERRRDSPPEDRPTLSTVIRDIKEAIVEELGPGAHSAKAMKRVFADIDLDGNGAVDKFELAKAMKKFGVPVSESKLDILFEKFEKRRGYFDYTDFIRFLDFQSKDEVADILKDIQDGVRDYLGPGAESAREMKRVFSDFDVDGNGTIEKREFVKAMKSLKVPVGEKMVDKIYAVYDTQGKGNLDYTEFIGLLDFRQKERSRTDIDSDSRQDSRDRSSDARK